VCIDVVYGVYWRRFVEKKFCQGDILYVRHNGTCQDTYWYLSIDILSLVKRQLVLVKKRDITELVKGLFPISVQ
jgi:hypothetical protein